MFCSQHDHPSLSLFDQTVRDADEEFYATFPEARDAVTRSTAIFRELNDDLNLVPLPYSQDLSWTGPVIVNDTHNSHSMAYHTPPSFFDPVSPPLSSEPSSLSRETPILQGRELRRRTLRFPTPELTNGCGVIHPDDLSKPTQINYFSKIQRRAHSISHLPSRVLSWDSHSPRSSLPLSPLLGKRHLEKKPPLACLFCRGRKIACGPPLPGSPNKTCNQCQRRSLRCEYPSGSRRGMRKKRSPPVAEATAANNQV